MQLEILDTLLFQLFSRKRKTRIILHIVFKAFVVGDVFIHQMAAQIMAEVERQSGASVTIETAILQRVLAAHVREQLDALADTVIGLAQEAAAIGPLVGSLVAHGDSA